VLWSDGCERWPVRSNKAIQARAAREGCFGFGERTLSATRFDLRRLSSTAITGTARTLHDIPALLELQKANLVAAGGTLSVQFSSEWIERSMAEMPIIVAERDGALVGYWVSSSRAATQHFALCEAKYHAYPARP
jgi:hypothetical protein